MITGYKLLQADGNMALAVEVERFIKLGEGWDVLGAPFVDPAIEQQHPFFQAIVKREPESAELQRLRDIERHVDRIVTELDNPCTDELGMVTFAHEELERLLRGGQWERKR